MRKILSLVSKWHDFVVSELARAGSSHVNAWNLVIRDRTVDCRMHREATMDPLTTSAASGMRAREEALDMLANNIANAATPGFKLDRENYNRYISEAAADGSDMPSAAPVLERNWTDFSQGALTPTGNSLDLALEGKGFFVVDGPNGPLYTRSGGFHMSANGRLESQDGYPVKVVDAKGAPVKLDPTMPVEVAKDGSVLQGGNTVGKLALADFQDTGALQKLGRTYFQVNGPISATVLNGTGVRQGSLEAANVVPSENAVRLVSVMRQFEMLQRAVTIAGDMNRKAVEEVARVS